MIACHGQPIWKTVLVCMIIFALYVFIVVPYVIVQTIIRSNDGKIQKGVKKIAGGLR